MCTLNLVSNQTFFTQSFLLTWLQKWHSDCPNHEISKSGHEIWCSQKKDSGHSHDQPNFCRIRTNQRIPNNIQCDFNVKVKKSGPIQSIIWFSKNESIEEKCYYVELKNGDVCFTVSVRIKTYFVSVLADRKLLRFWILLFCRFSKEVQRVKIYGKVQSVRLMKKL